MKKILIPTDFSEEAINALEFGLQIAKVKECEIILLHVCHRSFTYPEVSKHDHEKELEYANQLMDELVKQLALESFYKCKTFVIEGSVKDEIFRLIADEKIDLTIMGTRKTHSLIEVVSGSITYEVVKEGLCPVLIVPPDATPAGFKEIVIALDYKLINNKNLLSPLFNLIQPGASRAKVIHIQPDLDYKNKDEDQRVAEFKSLLSASFVEASFYVVEGEDVGDTLNDYTQEDKANLLVLISRDKKKKLLNSLFHHSIIKEMVHAPLLPILILPDQKTEKESQVLEKEKAKYMF